MKRSTLFFTLLAFVLGIGTALAQERTAGAGRVEIGAFPGGGVFFTKAANEAEPNFGDYALGVTGAYNINRLFGIEGEFGGGVGVKQKLDFELGTFDNQKSPHMLAYNGNLVVHPMGKNHAWVPYMTGGIGGLTVLKRNELADLGLTHNETFLTGNAGGGLKWFANRYWGLRGDYRFIAVDNKDTATSFFGLRDVRYGHRAYGSVVFTFGN
jgi:hypothetical protein